MDYDGTKDQTKFKKEKPVPVPKMETRTEMGHRTKPTVRKKIPRIRTKPEPLPKRETERPDPVHNRETEMPDPLPKRETKTEIGPRSKIKCRKETFPLKKNQK